MEVRDFKFNNGLTAVSASSEITKLIIPGRGVVKSREPFKFWRSPTISLEKTEAKVIKFCRLCQVPSNVGQIFLKRGGQGHVTQIKFWITNDIPGTAEARVVKFYTQ